MTFDTPEEELLWFLGKMSQPGWKWPSSRSALPPEHTAAMYCKYKIHSIGNFIYSHIVSVVVCFALPG